MAHNSNSHDAPSHDEWTTDNLS